MKKSDAAPANITGSAVESGSASMNSRRIMQLKPNTMTLAMTGRNDNGTKTVNNRGTATDGRTASVVSG